MKKFRLPGIFALVCCLLLGACSGPNTMNKDTIIAAVRNDAPGFSYPGEDGRLEGVEIDIANSIAQLLGKDITFTEVGDTEREPLLEQDGADMVIATFTITEERSQRMRFSETYYTDYITYLVKQDSGYRQPSDLNGKRIGVVRGTTPAEALEGTARDAGFVVNPEEYESFPEVVQALNEGYVDAGFMDASVLRGYTDENTVLMDANFAPQEYGIATRKDNKSFSNRIDEILQSMKEDGSLDALYKKWGI